MPNLTYRFVSELIVALAKDEVPAGSTVYVPPDLLDSAGDERAVRLQRHAERAHVTLREGQRGDSRIVVNVPGRSSGR